MIAAHHTHPSCVTCPRCPQPCVAYTTSSSFWAMSSAQSAPRTDRTLPTIHFSHQLCSLSHSNLNHPILSSRRSLRHCVALSPLPQAITLLLNTLLTLNPPVRARQQAQAETSGETDAAPAAAAADTAAAATGGRLLASLRQSIVAVRTRALKPEDRRGSSSRHSHTLHFSHHA